MNRGWLGLALIASLALGGCAHTPPPQVQAFYHSPANSYSLNLGSQALHGSLDMTEQCEPYGGSLNIWDSKNRFFRVD